MDDNLRRYSSSSLRQCCLRINNLSRVGKSTASLHRRNALLSRRHFAPCAAEAMKIIGLCRGNREKITWEDGPADEAKQFHLLLPLDAFTPTFNPTFLIDA